MEKIPFSEDELTVVKEVKSALRGSVRTYKTPITNRENFRHCFTDKCPLWVLPARGTSADITPKCVPDNIARGFVHSAEGFDNAANGGGPDMFGIEWVYVPQVGGSMVKPGNPTLEDANDWKKVIKEPDIDSWDWEGSAKANKDYLNNGKANMVWFLNGCWFERLISFMGFENAVMALIDDEQEDALKALFTKTTDLYCRLVDKCCETYGDGISGFVVHDDWGSQKDAFFSPEVGREIFLPFMKQLVDHIHSKGKIAYLHSCGCLNKQVGTFADAGWDSWTPMTMNDTVKMYDDYGDRIIIGVVPEAFDPATTSEEEQERLGAEFAKRFPLATCNGRGIVTPAFMKGYYKQSRIQANQN